METSTTTCNEVGSSTECITIANSFTKGEMFIGFILLLFFSLFFFDRLKTYIFGHKIEHQLK